MTPTNDARDGLLAMSLICFMTGIALVLSLAAGQTPAADGDTDYRSERRRAALQMAAELYAAERGSDLFAADRAGEGR